MRFLRLLGLVTLVPAVACAPSTSTEHGSAPSAPAPVRALLRASSGGAVAISAEGSRVSAGGITLRSDASGERLTVATREGVLSVTRVGARAGRVRLHEGAAQLESAHGPVAWTFPRGQAIEDLLVVEGAQSPGYRFALGAGARLSSIEGAPVVEVRDARGEPWARIAAPEAWDRDGRSVTVRPRVEGDVVLFEIDRAVPRPVYVDPTWAASSAPILVRDTPTITPLPDGTALVVGGTATSKLAERWDPIRGRFVMAGATGSARVGHAAVPLQDGRVLVVAGTQDPDGTELFDPKAGAFAPGPKLSAKRVDPIVVRLLDGRVLVAGGRDGATRYETSEIFDPKTGTFTAGPEMTVARAGAAAAVTRDGRVLVAFGTGGVSASTEWFVADGAGSFVAGPDLQAGRSAGALTRLADGRIVATTATFEPEVPDDGRAEILDPSVASPAWTAAAAPPSRVTRPGVLASPQGPLLTLGGFVQGFDGVITFADVRRFDADTGAWSSAPPLTAKRSVPSATLLGSGEALVVGGDAPSIDRLSFVADGEWSAAPSLSTGRKNGTATTLLDGRVWIAGGHGDTGLATTTEIFDPKTRTIASSATLATGRANHTATLLADGRVLIAGGDGVSTAEVLDPATGAVAAAGTMSVPRSGAAAVLLPSGKVLIGGGTASGSGAARATTEVWDPATSTFTAGPSMAAARTKHDMLPLRTGQILVVGSSTTSELYDPALGAFTALGASANARDEVKLAMLPSGEVLVVGGLGFGEIYDPLTRTFRSTRPSRAKQQHPQAVALPSGLVMVHSSFGFYESPAESELFDPVAGDGSGAFVTTSKLVSARNDTMVAPVDGGVGFFGGTSCGLCPTPLAVVETFDEAPAAGAVRPVVTDAPKTASPGATITVTGSGLEGNPSTGHGRVGAPNGGVPRVTWMGASARTILPLEVESFSATSLVVRVPATALRGPGRLFVLVDGLASAGVPLSIDAASSGVACSVGADCATGFCVEGVCCDAACTGVCQSCLAAKKGSGVDGTCGDVPPAKETADACFLGLGAACTGDGECGSGHCVDGVCCESACAGQCEACAVEGSFGKCIPVLGAPRGGRPACAAASGDDPCTARACDGVVRATCEGFVGKEVACRAGSCAADAATLPESCDGSGACPATKTSACAPYACGGDACGVGPCAKDDECASGYRCAIAPGATRGDCVVRTDLVCDGDHVVTAKDGASTDCSPYRCDVAGCKRNCDVSSDCVVGFLCERESRTCVAAPAADTSDAGGCHASRGASRGFTTLLLALPVALAALARRRRRA